jgi:hypothetical protein
VRLRYVPLAALRPATRYQRPLNEQHALDIALHFRWESCEALEVAANPDGTYTVVDGQHRHAALDLLFGATAPEEPVPVAVIAGADPERAAAARDINLRRKSWTGGSLFRLRLEAGERLPVAVAAMLAGLGLTPWLGATGGRGTPARGTVTGIATLERCAARAGLPSARHTVCVLKAAYGDDPAAYRAPLLRGVWDFLLRFADAPAYRGDVLVRALRGATVGGIGAAAGAKPVDPQTAVAWAVYDAYHRATRARLPAFTLPPAGRGQATALEARARAYRARHGADGEPV